jgi:hypothetical protein
VIRVREFKAAEERMRQLLHEGGLAQPDRVEYWETRVAFYWDEPKVVITVDVIPELDDAPPPS